MGVGAVVLLAGLAGLATLVGAGVARFEHLRSGSIREDVLRAVVAVGGGLLLAAVALVLVPEGLAGIGLAPALACLLGGALLFLLADKAVQRRGGRAGQVMASALDSVPESLGLGAAFALGGSVGPVLVLLIALQNLPEGFNGYRELHGSGSPSARSFGILASCALLDPLAAAVGFVVLGSHPAVVAALFLVAAGGILYIFVQDIAPLAHKDGHWAPTLGAVAGFGLGVVAQAVVG
jgi:ZIP family zinc transporter